MKSPDALDSSDVDVDVTEPSPASSRKVTPARGRLKAKAGWRGETSARVLADRLSKLPLQGPALVVDDTSGVVSAALTECGITHEAWHRFAIADQCALAWPPEGRFGVATVRLPKSRPAFLMVLHAVAARLDAGATVYVHGANDEGIKSAGRTLGAVFENARTVDARRHCRVWAATLPVSIDGLKPTLDAWAKPISVAAFGHTLTLRSYPGTFAHGKLDPGTDLLLASLPAPNPGVRVLDFGCGAGVIGASVLAAAPDAAVDLLEIYAPAAAAARENVPGASTILGDGWPALEGRCYDLIASNPPIHTGVGEDFRVLERLVEGAGGHLAAKGELWLVVQRTVPVERLLELHFRDVQVARENTQYRVWRGAGARDRR